MAAPKFSFSGWNSSSLAPKVNPATVPGAAGMTSQAASAGGAGKGLGTSVENGIVYQNGKLIGPVGSPAALAVGVAMGSVTGIQGTPTQDASAAMLAPGAPPGTVDTISGVNTPGTLVGTTNAANTNLPAWLQGEVDRLNAQDALRKQMTNTVTGGGGGSTAGDLGSILQGIAANTAARGQFNTSLNQINEQARLQSLIQRRNQMRPVGGFGFNNPMDVPAQIGLDREIEAYRNVNLPLAAGAAGGARSSGWVNPFRTF